MALPAVPSKVLKSFISLEEPEPIVRSTPTISKYQPRSHVEQLVIMPRSKANPLLTTFQSKSNANSVITMPRNSSATCTSRASMCSIAEDNHNKPLSSQANKNSSVVALRRKVAMKRPYSPWRTTIEIDDTSTVQKEHAPLCRAVSDNIIPSPYNPDKPLIKFPPIKSQMTHLARARSIKTTVGPLTEEVCKQLNILVESDNHNKVRSSLK